MSQADRQTDRNSGRRHIGHPSHWDDGATEGSKGFFWLTVALMVRGQSTVARAAW